MIENNVYFWVTRAPVLVLAVLATVLASPVLLLIYIWTLLTDKLDNYVYPPTPPRNPFESYTDYLARIRPPSPVSVSTDIPSFGFGDAAANRVNVDIVSSASVPLESSSPVSGFMSCSQAEPVSAVTVCRRAGDDPEASLVGVGGGALPAATPDSYLEDC